MRFLLPALLSCLVPLGALAPLAHGQQPPDKAPEKVLTVDATRAPRPSLKYRLLPDPREVTPGDAAPLYYRAMLPESLGHRRREKIDEDLQRWQTTPLAQIPKAEMEWILSYPALRLCDQAARRERCDWQLLERLHASGFSMTLEEPQLARELLRLLMLRARLEMADGRPDDAVRTLQTGLSLARQVGHGPLLISSLLGASFASSALNEVEELIQQPGAPNLYWALTALPSPLVEFHRGLEGERVAMEASIPEMKLVNRAMTTDEVSRLADRIRELLGSMEGLSGQNPPGNLEVLGQKATMLVMAEGLAVEGRKRLEAAGLAGNLLKSMPAVQVVLLDWTAQYAEIFDEQVRLSYLPYWHAHPRIRALERERKGSSIPVFSSLVPAIHRATFVSARLERQVAMLRTIEALRLYAAEQGKFPAKLADMIETPVPVDPVTGTAFEYTLDGEKAVLRAPPPAGDSYQTGNALHYVLVLRKRK